MTIASSACVSLDGRAYCPTIIPDSATGTASLPGAQRRTTISSATATDCDYCVKRRVGSVSSRLRSIWSSASSAGTYGNCIACRSHGMALCIYDPACAAATTTAVSCLRPAPAATTGNNQDLNSHVATWSERAVACECVDSITTKFGYDAASGTCPRPVCCKRSDYAQRLARCRCADADIALEDCCSSNWIADDYDTGAAVSNGCPTTTTASIRRACAVDLPAISPAAQPASPGSCSCGVVSASTASGIIYQRPGNRIGKANAAIAGVA